MEVVIVAIVAIVVGVVVVVQRGGDGLRATSVVDFVDWYSSNLGSLWTRVMTDSSRRGRTDEEID